MRLQRFSARLSLALPCALACNQPAQVVTVDDDTNSDVSSPTSPEEPPEETTSEETPPEEVEPSGPVDQSPTPEEICDGFDNNGNGLTDEGLVPEPCVTAQGAEATTRCLDGRVVCTLCVPGEIKELPCPCGLSRTDTCNSEGLWVAGLCDLCAPEERDTCDERDACIPSEVRFRRCDTCNGPDCGAECVGVREECNERCEWVAMGGCEIHPPQCGAHVENAPDLPTFVECSRCGWRERVCDGCFWRYGPCEQQKECTPGDQRVEPCQSICSEDLPEEGLFSQYDCDESCTWQETIDCGGCIVGTTVYEEEECVPGYPACGSEERRTVCTATETVPVCDGRDEVVVGAGQEELMVACPTDLCDPGDNYQEHCPLGMGCGTLTYTCSDACVFEAADSCSNELECSPGEIVSTGEFTCPGGCGTVSTTTRCDDDGCGMAETHDAACPCVPGQTRTVYCTMDSGPYDGCGGRATVTCEACGVWGEPGECSPSGVQCSPSDEPQTTSLPCPFGCGAYEVTTTCSATCRWEVSNSTEDSCSGECLAGTTSSDTCQEGCGTITRTCDPDTCTWGLWTECQLNPGSCTTGETKTEPCNTACGSGSIEYRCSACGWSVISECSAAPTVCVPHSQNREPCVVGHPMCGEKVQVCVGDGCSWSTWDVSSCSPEC